MQPHLATRPFVTLLATPTHFPNCLAAMIIGALALCPAQAAAQTPLAMDTPPATVSVDAAGLARSLQQSRPPAGDSLRNGTLIGASVGFATGFLGLAAFNAQETASGPIWDSEAVGYYTSAGLLGAGIGAGIGALIDALNKNEQSPLSKRRVAVRPVLGKDRRAVAASLRF